MLKVLVRRGRGCACRGVYGLSGQPNRIALQFSLGDRKVGEEEENKGVFHAIYFFNASISFLRASIWACCS